MDYITIVNLCWFIFAVIAMAVNFNNGWRKGIVDSHESITVPMIDHLLSHGYITAKKSDNTPINSKELAAYLVSTIASKK